MISPATMSLNPAVIELDVGPASRCPLWVTSGHVRVHQPMSALPPKADMCTALVHVCFGPKADILQCGRNWCTIRSPHRRGTAVIVTEGLRVLRLRNGMQIVGLVISWAVAIGIIGIGIGYAAKSEMNATGFGLPRLPEREARGWWQVKGVRDIVSGVLIIVAIITARADLWWLILVFSLIPLGDALVVLTNGGRKSAAFGIHGATAAAMIIAALLWITALPAVALGSGQGIVAGETSSPEVALSQRSTPES